MVKHIFLVEIGTEELPVKILRQLGNLFSKYVKNRFKKENITYKEILCFVSSRRLAIQVIDLLFSNIMQSDIINDNFLVNNNDIIVLLKMIVADALMEFPISVMMRWRDRNEKFIRPVRTVTILLDDKIIPSMFFGVPTDRVIRGHRFMGKQNIVLDHAGNYQKVLLECGFVIVDYAIRREIIRSGINGIIKNIGGVLDSNLDPLLEEMVAVSEWPVVLLGSFDKKFLSIPYEILLYMIKIKKKYFPIYDSHGKLLPYFIFIIDIITSNFKEIVFMHEKFLSSCFSDIEFFLNYDKKYNLEDYLVRLNNVSFYRRLGSLYDKTVRIKFLSIWLANKIGVDIFQVERAAILSKCDLLSSIVSEFPMLQGVIGMYYARRDGELEVVALAQKEQYFPKFFSGVLPSTLVSCIVSIADKIDTISGMFIIGKDPQGDGDPLGIRRAAFGVLRIILAKKLDINLLDLIKYSLYLYKDLVCFNSLCDSLSIDQFVNKISNFMYQRLCILYKKLGYKINMIRAILSEDSIIDLVDYEKRLYDLCAFCNLQEEFFLLFAIFKRIFNIFKKFPDGYRYEFKDCFLIEEEEVVLAKKLVSIDYDLELKCSSKDYCGALILLTTLHDPVDKFFNSVVVMCEDENISQNRLALLQRATVLLLKIIPYPKYIWGK